MGNTQLKWVQADDGVIDQATLRRGSAEQFAEHAVEQQVGPESLLLSSVAPAEKTNSFVDLCRRQLGLEVRQLRSSAESNGIRNGYRNPAKLGVDRWLAIIGACHHYGTPVVIMDIGTATTLDAVDRQGQHLGGLILPGPELMLRSLGTDTAMRVPSEFGRDQREASTGQQRGVGPGMDTDSALLGGVLAAQVGALNQFMRRVSENMESKPELVLTGGAAGGILDYFERSPIIDPWLVFKGMLQHTR